VWSPRVIGEVDDAYIKVANVKGSLAWHSHEREDELFVVLQGQLRIEMESGALAITPVVCGDKPPLKPHTASPGNVVGISHSTLNPFPIMAQQMIRLNTFLLALLMLTGCGPQVGPATPANSAGINSNSKGIPSEAPYIQGAITSVAEGLILVEEHAAQAAGSAKASLRLTSSTRILHRSGLAARPSDLRVGQHVQAWVAGPVMESYPTQGTAAVVVIEP